MQESCDGKVTRRLVDHLSRHCAECWKSVGATEPYDHEGPRTFDPAIAALRRAHAADCDWMALAANHIEVLGQLREMPFGFSFLVIEEAAAMLEDPRFELDALGCALGFAGADLSRLFRSRPPKLDVVVQYLATVFQASLLRGEVEDVLDGLGALAQGGKRLESSETYLKILEVSATSARMIGELDEARRDLAQAYRLTLNERPYRNLEIGQELAALLSEMYPEQKDLLADLIGDVTEIHGILLGGDRPEMRFYAVLLLARFLSSIDVELRRRPDDDDAISVTDVVPLEVVRQTYQALKDCETYFELHTSPEVRAERWRYLFNLGLFVEPRRALETAGKLHAAYEKLGGDYWHEALAIRGVMVALERERDPQGSEREVRGFLKELRSRLKPEQIEAFCEEVSELVPSADLRLLVADAGS